MKNIILFFAFALATVKLLAQEETAASNGIRFEHSAWNDILAKAASENKIVFLDAYASWCGPCKWMDKNVFPLAKAGDYFNSHFVNAKIDMEKGEGPVIAKKYGIRAYPTYLFVDGNGVMVHKFLGSMEMDKFLESAGRALDPERSYSALLKKFELGKSTPDDLYTFANAAWNADELATMRKAAELYLKTQTDWLTEKNLQFISNFTSSAEQGTYAFMRMHPEEFRKILGDVAYKEKMAQLAERGWIDASAKIEASATADAKIKAAAAYFENVLPDQAGQLTAANAMNVYLSAKDMDRYAQQAIKYYKEYPSNSSGELNSIAWKFYEKVDNLEYIKEAVGWGLRSVQLGEGYANLDTVASLYFKLGNKNKAREYAERAIAKGKSTNQDVAATEQLLEKINHLQ